MKKLLILLAVALMALPMAAKKKQVKQQTDREYWCEQAYKMAQPVLENMAKGELQKNMKVEVSPNWDGRHRRGSAAQATARVGAGRLQACRRP